MPTVDYPLALGQEIDRRLLARDHIVPVGWDVELAVGVNEILAIFAAGRKCPVANIFAESGSFGRVVKHGLRGIEMGWIIAQAMRDGGSAVATILSQIVLDEDVPDRRDVDLLAGRAPPDRYRPCWAV